MQCTVVQTHAPKQRQSVHESSQEDLIGFLIQTFFVCSLFSQQDQKLVVSLMLQNTIVSPGFVFILALFLKEYY